MIELTDGRSTTGVVRNLPEEMKTKVTNAAARSEESRLSNAARNSLI